jgi:Xaa-Pro aminopeptidase
MNIAALKEAAEKATQDAEDVVDALRAGLDFRAQANPYTILSLIERAEQLEAALREVMEWVRNWSPNFTDDDEWPETKAKVEAALSNPTETVK